MLPTLRIAIAGLFLCVSALAAGQYVPAQNIHPGSAAIRLDSSFQSDAWLVYTYDIDEEGSVSDATIRSSNGVLEVEQAVLQQLKTMRFRPAMRGGTPVASSAPPVTYTWILDARRELSPRFAELYRQAWDHYAREDYSATGDIAVLLRDFPGRNALEEVKARLLSASLAGKIGDSASELRHLQRVAQLQDLAIDNNFNNRYVPNEQYLQVLKRIQQLQLDSGLLADAEATLARIRRLGGASPAVSEAAVAYSAGEAVLRAQQQVLTAGELQALYPGGPGAWRAGLFRRAFALVDVSGSIDGVFLVCGSQERLLRYPSPGNWLVPAGWSNCEIDITGQAGTRFTLRQLQQ